MDTTTNVTLITDKKEYTNWLNSCHENGITGFAEMSLDLLKEILLGDDDE